jgi:hypothetical protein
MGSRAGPPPPPRLEISDGYLYQWGRGGDDYGGKGRLYTAPYPGGPLTLAVTQDWAQEIYWGALDELYDQVLYVSEVGNGSAYVGESEIVFAYDNRGE